MAEVRSKLVIIGNGFDLAHGFKTSYTDFIIWYLNDCIQKTYEQFNYRDTLLETSRPNIIRTFQKVTVIKDFQEISAKNDIKIIRISPFFEKLINSHNEYNWVDIENEYYQSVVSYYENVRNNSSRMDWISELKKLNEEFEFLRDKLEEYLTEVQANAISKFKIDSDGKINRIFDDIFSKINSENLTFHTVYKKVIFLNFNYTDTIEKFFRFHSRKNQTEIIYIHGKLNDKENPVIFGFGDETDEYYEKIENLKINDFLNNFKSFWYFKTDNYQRLLKIIDEQPYDIEILGHSCGLSDRVLLSTIFQHDNCKSIKIHYYAKSDTENDFFSKTQEISRHFRDKAKMRKLIVNFRDCDSIN